MMNFMAYLHIIFNTYVSSLTPNNLFSSFMSVNYHVNIWKRCRPHMTVLIWFTSLDSALGLQIAPRNVKKTSSIIRRTTIFLTLSCDFGLQRWQVLLRLEMLSCPWQLFSCFINRQQQNSNRTCGCGSVIPLLPSWWFYEALGSNGCAEHEFLPWRAGEKKWASEGADIYIYIYICTHTYFYDLIAMIAIYGVC